MFSRPVPIVVMVVCAVIGHKASLAQLPVATILEIETQNTVSYISDTFDFSKLATDPNRTTSPAPRAFSTLVAVSDIVAVNGRPAKGALVQRVTGVRLSPMVTPGFALADTFRLVVEDDFFEILQADGTAIGTIMVSAMGGGPPPPGAPLGSMGFNGTVTGGTGAFLGVQGQMTTSGGGPPRFASVTEDPSNRRIHGGGSGRWLLHLIPLARPEIAVTPNGPSVWHTDFSQVTPDRAARVGELLIVVASGLGPTRPGVDPGKPFPSLTEGPRKVNSPVEVLVNGKTAEVVNQIGWPGLVDTYRVDFRVPDGTTLGDVSIQLSVAWIAGAEVKIRVQ